MNDSKSLINLSVLYEKIQDYIKERKFDKVFESLELVSTLEKQFLETYQKKKKEGVYYTSENISDIIVSWALLFYINKKCFESLGLTLQVKNLDDICNLDEKIKETIVGVLLESTICDPACGSGAFLLSSARILFNLLKKIQPEYSNISLVHLILKNLNGFDINKKAIELCVLKLYHWGFSMTNKCDERIFSAIQLKVKDSLFAKISKKYDIIIGNPPYGNILDKSKKKLLKAQNLFYKDVYCTFLVKALDWSKNIACFLVPKSFLLRQDYVHFRLTLLKKACIRKIVDFGPNFFKGATNEVQVVIYENYSREDRPLDVYNYPNNKIITYPRQDFDSLRICPNDNCLLSFKSKKIRTYVKSTECPYCKSKAIKLNRIRIKASSTQLDFINKIENVGDLNYLNVKEFPKMIRGEEDIGLREVKKHLKNDLGGNCMFINAKQDFSAYHLKKTRSFTLEDIDPEVLKGDNYEYYIGPKLLIKHNNIYPEAIFTSENACFTSSIYSLLHEDQEELKYLSAVLNSKLIKFYCTYGINNQKGTTINLNQYMIRHLPIISPNIKMKVDINETVDKIISSLEQNNGKHDIRIKKWFSEIDLLICDLYGVKFDNIIF
ncbi:MAG: Eco57I restriction-modification methylase domain-containing protein [Promethearchaeota archaeon]